MNKIFIMFACSMMSLYSCAHKIKRPKIQKPDLAILHIDNFGGFSHGGSRYSLYKNALCVHTSYTDVVGQDIVKKYHYSFSPDKNILTLRKTSDQATMRLHKFAYSGNVYWLNDSEIKTPEKIIQSYARTTLREKP